MIIKKYQGKTENDAVEAAKKELGQNLVVMNVRNVKKKGFFHFFSSEQIEVTVALEDENEKFSPVKKEEKKVVPLQQASPVEKEIIPKPVLNESGGERNENRMIEEKLDNLHILLEQQMQKPEEEKEEYVEEEPDELEKFMKLLYHTMMENEVSEPYARQILEEMKKSVKPNTPFDYALANIYQKMILKFGKQASIVPSGNKTKMIFFIGPTGVGKTTTIAKIASKYIVEEKKKVALLTADTYRIAAAEQLRTYASILEVPFRVVYTPEEISVALHDFTLFDYIFVDTSGHSYQNEEQKRRMTEIIHSTDGLAEREVFLVLSATTKYNDLLNIVDAYSQVTDYKLIFTKLDETGALGNLLNIRLHTGVPLAYTTCGQNVPDDIEVFNPQKTVKLLLGGKK